MTPENVLMWSAAICAASITATLVVALMAAVYQEIRAWRKP